MTANLDALQKAVAGYGPNDAQKATFQSSFFGSVFGLATAAVLSAGSLMLAVYLVTTFVAGSLVPMSATERIIFAVVLAPALVIAAFFIVPLIAKVRRDRAILHLSTDPAVRHGYFRLGPWTGAQEDVRTFRRPDGREARARDWLTGARSPVLYLSGASGVGKSSLVESYLVPALRAQGWTVLSVRGMGNPHAALKRTLEEAAGAPAEGLREALARAVQHLGAGPGKPLLVILDQFEEFLTLETRPDGDYAAFLRDLAAHPVAHVRLLHVFREDYRAQLFELGLPDFTRETGFDLPRLDRRQAEAFLRGGPRKLDDAGYQALLDGLNRIEDTPGLYRLITLNLVGIILDRQGDTIPRNPAALIRDYLTSVIGAGPTRDLHVPILRAMLTAEGTRIPVATGALATAAGTEGPKCRAALAHLADEGLVRPAGPDRWEISHDFLARQIATLLPTLRRPAVERYGPAMLVALVVGWMAAAGLGWPLWNAHQDRIAAAALRDMGLIQWNCGGPVCFAYDVSFAPDPRRTDLAPAAPHLRRLGAKVLDLSGADGITDLSPLAGLPLTILDLSRTDVIDLSPLAGMPLTILLLSFATGNIDLSPLPGTPLSFLDLSYSTGDIDLSPLAGLPLTFLDLTGTGVTDLSPLAGIAGLEIRGATEAQLATLGR